MPQNVSVTPSAGRAARLLVPLTGVFVACLVLIPSTASKFIALGPFALSGATLVFPIVFIFNDVLTEVYGYARARQVIWTGMACQVLASFFYWLVGMWPAATFWDNQAAYDSILGTTWRITIASLSAYFCSEFVNSYIMSRMKYFARGARGAAQAGRYIASTLVGQLVDSMIFMGVGFAGVLAKGDLVKTILTIWLAKTAYEVVALPLSMPFANWLKRVEGVDALDDPNRTNYNPFQVRQAPAPTEAPTK